MCTVSWLHDADGYQLLCNRDEKRNRPVALPPRPETLDGIRFLAPLDGAFGGTWIAVNEFGLSLCLLNGVDAPRRQAECERSRGLLILDLLAEPSIACVRERLRTTSLSRYAPFTLAVIGAARSSALLEWNGAGKVWIPDGGRHVPLISSSFEPLAVQRRRRREFNRRLRSSGNRLDPTLLSDFHRSHGQAPGPFSACMHRDDAETVSFSRIQVSTAGIEFAYSPGAPCAGMPESVLRLVRRN